MESKMVAGNWNGPLWVSILFCAYMYNPVFGYFFVCKDNKSLQIEQ